MNHQNQKRMVGQDHVPEWKKTLEEIEKEVLEKYPLAVRRDEKGCIIFRDAKEIDILMNQNSANNKKSNMGRGGNNVSENVKKSIRSIFMKNLSKPLFDEYTERYIKKYHLKSQKQNYILYFLFLFELKNEGKITDVVIQSLIDDIRAKIEKYAFNSEQRMNSEPDRREFHMKNLVQFRKFTQIDLDFDKPRRYSEIKESIKTLYLKKQAVYVQAEKKVRRILKQHPGLSRIFEDWVEQADPSPPNSEKSSSEEFNQENWSEMSS